MAPDEDPAPAPRAPGEIDDAFAATIAPPASAAAPTPAPDRALTTSLGTPSGTAPGAAARASHDATDPVAVDARDLPAGARKTRIGRPTDPNVLGGEATRAPAPAGSFGEGLNTEDHVELASGETISSPVASDVQLPIVSEAHYRTDREIARGGMGRIVAAEDQRLGRPVALKQLLEPAGDALGRFQREALITARLQHPGIVPVYEAGRWPSGEPFFAMKLVTGQPLDRVIAEAKTFHQRLALLPRIAAATDAIAYAHSHNIVHRDLKPGNVLVGAFGEVVVIDWGLAKDLEVGDSFESGTRLPKRPSLQRPITRITRSAPGGSGPDSSTLTVAGAVMGTPAYMPPEQARGERVDRRADVFALGAMLYHALAGVPPYNARTATDVIAAAALGRVVPLREREPGVPADLVAIIERAMALEAADRYQDAGQLADDLRQFLTGQLVSSHEYTIAQRIARFVKRHRAAVTIASIAIVAFVVFGTLAIRQIVEQRDDARAQRRLADMRREAAETLIDRMLSDVKDRLIGIGRLDLLSSLGGQIRDYYGKLETAPGGMPAGDLDRMATAIELIGRAERDSGQAERAFKTWTQARAQLANAVGADASPTTFRTRRMIAHLDYAIGTIHQARGGKMSAALGAYAKARSEYQALREEQPNDRETLLGCADNHDRLGDLSRNDGKIDRAFEEYSEAKAARERASSQASSRPTEELLALSTSHHKLGSVYQARGESATALAEYKAALRLRETVLEGQPDNVDVQEKVLEVQSTLGELQRQVGDDKNAIASYEQARQVMDALLRRDPTNTAWRRQHGNLLADLGFALLDGGDFKGGLAQLALAIESQRDLVMRDPRNSSWQVDLSRSYTRAGDGYVSLGALDEGITRYQLALEIRDKLAARDPKLVPYRRSVAWSHAKLGNAYAHRGDATRAIDENEQALALRAKLVEDAPAQSGFKNELASTEIALGKLIAGRDPKRCAQLIAAGLARARALVTGDAINTEWRETLTQGLLAQSDAAKAGIAISGTAADLAESRRAALTEALAVAEATAKQAPSSTQWPVFLAEIHAGLAEIAGDAKDAAAEWKLVRDMLEPLAAAGRLPAPRKVLLERARSSLARGSSAPGSSGAARTGR